MSGAGMATEMLAWHPAGERPDSDTTVLCWDGATPFFTGFWDDERQCWIDCESGAGVLGVTHWAEPRGPV